MSDEELKSLVKAGHEIRVGSMVIPKKSHEITDHEAGPGYHDEMSKCPDGGYEVKEIIDAMYNTEYRLSNGFYYLESWLTRI